jgi:tryptophan-rich sensory protein
MDNFIIITGIAWTILLLLLGLAWVHALEVNDEISKNHVYWFYGLLTVSLMMWIILYGCEKNSLAATWTIIISIMLALQQLDQIHRNYLFLH